MVGMANAYLNQVVHPGWQIQGFHLKVFWISVDIDNYTSCNCENIKFNLSDEWLNQVRLTDLSYMAHYFLICSMIYLRSFLLTETGDRKRAVVMRKLISRISKRKRELEGLFPPIKIHMSTLKVAAKLNQETTQ